MEKLSGRIETSPKIVENNEGQLEYIPNYREVHLGDVIEKVNEIVDFCNKIENIINDMSNNVSLRSHGHRDSDIAKGV